MQFKTLHALQHIRTTYSDCIWCFRCDNTFHDVLKITAECNLKLYMLIVSVLLQVSHFLLNFSKTLSSYYSRYHILGVNSLAFKSCVCVCVCDALCVHAYVVCACAHVHACVCMHLWVCVYVCACLCVCLSLSLSVSLSPCFVDRVGSVYMSVSDDLKVW